MILARSATLKLLKTVVSVSVFTPDNSTPGSLCRSVGSKPLIAVESVAGVSPVSKLPESALATVWESVPFAKLVRRLETVPLVSVEKVSLEKLWSTSVEREPSVEVSVVI